MGNITDARATPCYNGYTRLNVILHKTRFTGTLPSDAFRLPFDMLTIDGSIVLFIHVQKM